MLSFLWPELSHMASLTTRELGNTHLPQMWGALLNSVTYSYYELGTVLGAADIIVGKVDLIPVLAEVTFQDGLGGEGVVAYLGIW